MDALHDKLQDFIVLVNADQAPKDALINALHAFGAACIPDLAAPVPCTAWLALAHALGGGGKGGGDKSRQPVQQALAYLLLKSPARVAAMAECDPLMAAAAQGLLAAHATPVEQAMLYPHPFSLICAPQAAAAALRHCGGAAELAAAAAAFLRRGATEAGTERIPACAALWPIAESSMLEVLQSLASVSSEMASAICGPSAQALMLEPLARSGLAAACTRQRAAEVVAAVASWEKLPTTLTGGAPGLPKALAKMLASPEATEEERHAAAHALQLLVCREGGQPPGRERGTPAVLRPKRHALRRAKAQSMSSVRDLP
jgi:hypothetical protein